MQTVSSAMKLTSVCLGIAAMLGTHYAAAQAYGFDSSPVILSRPQLGLTRLGCPVEVKASQRSLGHQVETRDMISARPAQGLTVTVNGFMRTRITSAEIVAHGLSPKNRTVLTATSNDPDVMRTFHLVAKDGGGFHGDLWMEGVSSILWIEVKSLTYSDGSVWHESDTQKCTVRPDTFVLISSLR